MTVLEPVIEFLLTKKVGAQVSLDDITTGAERPRRPVLRVLDRLVADGNLEEVEDRPIMPRLGECGPPRRCPVWKIVRSPKLEVYHGPKRLTHRDRIWSAVRSQRNFTVADLVLISGVCEGTVVSYLRMLERENYIARTGRSGHAVKYILRPSMNVGPTRPVIKEKQDRRNRNHDQ